MPKHDASHELAKRRRMSACPVAFMWSLLLQLPGTMNEQGEDDEVRMQDKWGYSTAIDGHCPY